MTILDCIQYVDGIMPNAYNNEQKARWLRECEGKVYTQLFLQQTFDFPDLTPWAMMGLELAIPAPYNKIYPLYLEAQIHYHNAEPDRYNMTMSLFNSAWHEVCVWFGQDFDISDRARNRRITVPIIIDAEEQTLLLSKLLNRKLPRHCPNSPRLRLRAMSQEMYLRQELPARSSRS